MNKYLYKLVVILIVFFFSCNENIKKEYYKTGVLKSEYITNNALEQSEFIEYYVNGNVKSITLYNKEKKIDSLISYYMEYKEKRKSKVIYDNSQESRYVKYDTLGFKISEGPVNDFGAIGRWSIYDNKGLLNGIKYYKTINKKEYLNQIIKLDKEGDTLYYPSTFFETYTSRDTINLGEPYNVILKLYVPYYKHKKTECYVMLDDDRPFTSDFSNEFEIKKDTFYNLTKDIKNQKWFPNDAVRYEDIVVFGKLYKIPGNKILRGVLVEYYKEYLESEKDTVTIFTKKYFERNLYVKDTIARCR